MVSYQKAEPSKNKSPVKKDIQSLQTKFYRISRLKPLA